MNRRRFLKAFAMAAVGAAVAPAVMRIAPSVAAVPAPAPTIDLLNQATFDAIYPRMITDNFFRSAPMFHYLRQRDMISMAGGGTIHAYTNIRIDEV